jgi:integrase
MTDVRLYKAKRQTRLCPERRVWMLRWVGTDGRRYCETLGDADTLSKRDAERLRRARQSRMDCNEVPVNRPPRLSLAELLDRHREAVRTDVRATTLIEYEHAARHAIAALGREIALDRIGHAEVARVKNYMSEELDLSPATIRKTVRAMCVIMNRAMKERLITSNPFAGQAKGRTQSKAKRIFQPEEVEAMIAVAPSLWWKTFIRLAVTSGLRRGELLSLHWRDVDFKAKRLTVSRKDAGEFEVKDERYHMPAISVP